MAITKGMMSSQHHGWETPPEFFDRLDRQFQFTLDAAANAENAKCRTYYTEKDNALIQPWMGNVWCNPPYGRQIGTFVQKGWEEAQKSYCQVVVMLVPSRTDTAWWHRWAMMAKEIWLVRGRLRFVGAPSSAPFPSAVLVFNAGNHKPAFHAIDAKE